MVTIPEDTKDGYTPITHKVTRAVINGELGLSEHELKVFLFILDETFGWKKPAKQLSCRFIGDHIDMAYQNVKKAIDRLVMRRMVIVNYITKQKRELGVNLDYSQWLNRNEIYYCNRNNYGSVIESITGTVIESTTDTIISKKKKEEIIRAERLTALGAFFLSLWEMYPEWHRGDIKWIKTDIEAEIVEHADDVKIALEAYLAQTDDKYICNAEKFFSGKWKAYAPITDARRDEEDDFQ